MKRIIVELIEKMGGRFSRELGIDLEGGSGEIFKWFLASLLFGARIGQDIAIRTYREFEKRDVLSSDQIVETGWDGLVEILDEGGYARYDFKTATKLLEIMEYLNSRYGGDLKRLHARARDSKDLETRLLGFRGVGPVTVNIFLRELRGIWEKANPIPSDLALLAARNLGIVGKERGEQALVILKKLWEENEVAGAGFSDFEVALVRLGKDFCRGDDCNHCIMREHCGKRG
ncbi:MAG: hypothetical protein QMD08_07660 [Actinomycetota bacterium]|nr:hypothetical protein [Actinomycetota bacterium]